ncbi:LrgB family protein, partial [Mycobacterium tuberculosis]|nr:LrgB family protein [Mycobacterium tuberculosis]
APAPRAAFARRSDRPAILFALHWLEHGGAEAFAFATIAAAAAAGWRVVVAADRPGRHPLANPVLISIVILSGFLVAAGIDYRDYFKGAQFVHFLLGPATVALAIPLYRTWTLVRRALAAVLISVLVGGLVAAGAGVVLAMLLGADASVVASLVPRSVTTPVAMGISERINGLPSLTATVVVLTGITGAVIGTHVLNLVRVKDWRARGLAMGTAAHAIGTARALSV